MSDEPLRNRIVEHGEIDPRELKANPLNWRLHPEIQRAAVRDSLEQVGWVRDVLINRTTGNMIDGHLRVEDAIEHDEATVPYSMVELTEDEERLVLASLDSTTPLAVPDPAKLDALLADLEVSGSVLRGVLDDLRQASAHAEPTRATNPSAEDFWPRINVQVPPEVHARWNAALAEFDGEGDHEKVAAMLDVLVPVAE